MLKIISGAQTGVDRGALDAALNNNVQCGGWVPNDRKAEDGVISEDYPVYVLSGAGYRQRTKKNVQDSDGTVIIYFGSMSGGTEQTLRFCLNEHKPYLLLDALELLPERAAVRINEFLNSIKGETLNFAGPRVSSEKNAHGYTLQSVSKFIAVYNNNDL
jgi:hypothetical protein